MSAIDRHIGREILDSRGNPTVEVDVSWKAGPLAVPPCRQVPQRARMKRGTRDGDGPLSAARAFRALSTP